MAEVATSFLNYADKKRQALSSKSYRTIIPSAQGGKFSLGQTVTINLAGNMSNSFYDFQNSYLMFKVANTHTNKTHRLEGGCGAYSLIRKLEIISNGTTLESIDNYNVLADMMLDQDSSHSWKNNQGKVLMGTGRSKSNGRVLDASQKFCLPLILNCLFNSAKYIPAFSASQIQIKITFDIADNCIVSPNPTLTSDADDTTTPPTAAIYAYDNALDANIEISEVEFVANVVQLSEDAMQMVDANTGGLYEMVCDSYRHASSTVTASETSKVVPCGFSFSSLNRVLIAHRSQKTAHQKAGSVHIGNRYNPALVEATFQINGNNTPARAIKGSGTSTSEGSAEILAELLIADRALSVFSHDSSLIGSNMNDGVDTFSLGGGASTGKDHTNTGTFFIGIDCESVRANDNDKIYAGQNTIGATTAVALRYGGGANCVAGVIDIFAQYSARIVLDMGGNRTFEVRV